jgi:aspartyl-tRNA(Asn)/glutamyl-tRNA(Gln) amidotransferase subunit A
MAHKVVDRDPEEDLPAGLGVCALSLAFQQKRVSPSEITREYLDRISRDNPRLHAFIHVAADCALKQAHASTKRWSLGQPLSLLDGVPLAIKDNIAVAGLPCTAGTAALAGRLSVADARVWKTLKEAGAVMLGKLNMHEAALGATTDNPVYGRCFNPVYENYSPGGSSGGSAAAVAGAMCAASLGTDTMGSVRIPAANCGLFGFTVSHAALSMEGIIPLSPLLDTLGLFARTGADLAVVSQCQLGLASLQPKNWQGLRVGLLPRAFYTDLEPSVLEAYERRQQSIVASGAQLQTMPMKTWQPTFSRRQALLVAEVQAAYYWYAELGPQLAGLSAELVSMLRYGHALEAQKRTRAFNHLSEIRNDAAELFAHLDLLFLPTTPQRSWPIGEAAPDNQADFSVLANLLGAPSLAFPCPVQAERPASCLLVAAPGQDRLLLSLAGSLDQLDS